MDTGCLEEEGADIARLFATNLDTGVEVCLDFIGQLRIGRRAGQRAIGDLEGLFDNRVMSRNHASLHYRQGMFHLQDTNSANGTLLNSQRLKPFREARVFSADILEFGTEVGAIRPLRIRVMLYHPSGRRCEERREEVMEVSSRDLAELAAILVEANTDLAGLEGKLVALEAVVEQVRARGESGAVMARLDSIEAAVEGLRVSMESREDLGAALRRVLEELEAEGSGEVVSGLARRLRGEQGEQYTLERVAREEPRGGSKSSLTKSESAPLLLVPEAGDPGGPRGILKPPGSPRRPRPPRVCRMSSVPEVWEIESCLEEQLGEGEQGAVHRTCSMETLVPAAPEEAATPRQRKWKQISDRISISDIASPVVAEIRQTQQDKKEDGKIIQTKSTIRDVTSPIISEIRNRKTQHEKTEDGKNIQIKSSSEDKRANVAANPNVNVADLKDIRVRIDQVHAVVRDASREVRLAVTQFIGTIQGLLFCFVFAILILAVGLRKQPNMLEFF